MVKLLIVGATGLVGTLVLERALADDRVSRVIALTRRPIAPRDKLENVVVDFANLPDGAAWWSVDGVVSALGTTRATAASRSAYRAVEFDFPIAIARQARAQGATRFALTSSVGANPRSPFVYPRTKGELEAGLKTLGFPSLTIVRPGVLDGPRERFRLDERAAKVIFRVLAPVLPRSLHVSPAGAVAATLMDGAIDAPPGVHLKTNQDMNPGSGPA